MTHTKSLACQKISRKLLIANHNHEIQASPEFG